MIFYWVLPILNLYCLFVVLIGTIRRFLEHYGDGIDVVVFVTDGQEVRISVFVCVRVYMPPSRSFMPSLLC